ncbi:hypothetical protein E2C01_102790 [Portunus trituberculatus]|uniref:Uncharacterized protein n=1 Tax=Portunus trituberculatus TaxID=210409 RepID=A0A5B7K945_PORTR|nr:hypothetical protein [Portunus trituberculatus]
MSSVLPVYTSLITLLSTSPFVSHHPPVCPRVSRLTLRVKMFGGVDSGLAHACIRTLPDHQVLLRLLSH